MAAKIKVREDQVVERVDGKVKWISDSGELNENTEAEISVLAAAPDKAPEAPVPPVAQAPKPAKAVKAPAKVSAPKPTTKSAPAPTPAVSSTEKPNEKAAKPVASKPKEKTVAKAKKKAVAKGTRTIGGKPVDLSHYVKVKTAAGGTSYNIGDATAKKLEGKTLDEVYKIVAKDTKQNESDLRKKYGKINPGLQRMALGNMHRKGPREAKPVKKAA